MLGDRYCAAFSKVKLKVKCLRGHCTWKDLRVSKGNEIYWWESDIDHLKKMNKPKHHISMKIDFLLIKCDGWTRTLLSLYSLPFLTRKFTERMQSQSQLLLHAGHCQVHGARNIFCGFLAATTKWFCSLQRPYSSLFCPQGQTLWNGWRHIRREVLRHMLLHCHVMLHSATKGQWHRNDLKLCLSGNQWRCWCWWL